MCVQFPVVVPINGVISCEDFDQNFHSLKAFVDAFCNLDQIIADIEMWATEAESSAEAAILALEQIQLIQQQLQPLVNAITELLNLEANLDDILAVEAALTNINIVASNIADVNTVAAGIVDIANVAANIANVNTVAGSIGNVNAVGGDIANVNIVAGDIANVNTVATNMTGLLQIVTNLATILDASNQAAIAVQAALDAEQARDEIVANIDFTGAVDGDLLQHNGSKFVPISVDNLFQNFSLDIRIALDIEPAFVMQVDTSVSGTGTVTATNQFQFTGAVGDYSVEAYAGTNLVQTYNGLTGEQTITLPTAGVYKLRVIPASSGGFSAIQYNNGGDRQKVKKILNWGTGVTWSSFASAFWGCAIDELPNQPIRNATSVTNFSNCFRDNQITNIPADIFRYSTSVNNFNSCFQQNNVTTIPVDLFRYTTAVTTFINCFRGNQITTIPVDLFRYNTSVTSFAQCFHTNNLTNIPVDLFRYNTSVTSFLNCFLGNTINTSDYSRLLVELDTYNLNNNVPFHGGNSQYTGVPAITARGDLVGRGWTITDGGVI